MVANDDMVIVARFSPFKASIIALIIFGPTAVFMYLIFSSSGGLVGLIEQRHPVIGSAIVALTASAWFIFRIGAIFFQIFFRQGAAIWVDDQNLIFTNQRIMKLQIADIDHFSPEKFLCLGINIKIIGIYLGKGDRRVLSIGLMQEQQSYIISRLDTILRKKSYST